MSEENIYTFENPEYRKTYWHSCSHVLAQAVKRLYPEVKLAIGPAIENGFYYDFDAPMNFTQEHLEAIGRLHELGRIETLPEKLKETIVLRETYPELTLSELAAEFDPPVSKSCLNHRLRKLVELSKE